MWQPIDKEEEVLIEQDHSLHLHSQMKHNKCIHVQIQAMILNILERGVKLIILIKLKLIIKKEFKNR